MLTAFAMLSVLGIVSDSAGGAPEQKERSPSTAAKDHAAPSDATPADAAASSLPSPDLAAVKVAIALARKGQSDVGEGIGDPVARKVVEWVILRENNAVDFQRYVAFISDNPSWPGIGLLRRRAESALWKERFDPRTVRGY
jgi:soluble lytic murein transglycosylase